MTLDEALDYVGVSHTSFYKLKKKLGIITYDYGFNIKDLDRMIVERKKFRKWATYRVSVWDGIHFIVQHVNKTKEEALRLCKEYTKMGIPCMAKSCDGKNTPLYW